MTVTSRTDGVVEHPDRHGTDRVRASGWCRDVTPANGRDADAAVDDDVEASTLYDIASAELFDVSAELDDVEAAEPADRVAPRRSHVAPAGLPVTEAPAGLPVADPIACLSRTRRPVVSSIPIRCPDPGSAAAGPGGAVPPVPARRRVGSSHLPLHLRQRRARLSVFVVLAVTAGLTILALLTARSPAVPTTSVVPTSSPVSVSTGGRVGVGTAGLAPSIQPPPAAAPLGTSGSAPVTAGPVVTAAPAP